MSLNSLRKLAQEPINTDSLFGINAMQFESK